MTTTASDTWLDSRATCEVLGVSRTTLQHLKNEGILKPGIHYYRRGVGLRGALRWDVKTCRQVLLERTRRNPATFESFALPDA